MDKDKSWFDIKKRKNISKEKGGVKFRIYKEEDKETKEAKELINSLNRIFIWLSKR